MESDNSMGRTLEESICGKLKELERKGDVEILWENGKEMIISTGAIFYLSFDKDKVRVDYLYPTSTKNARGNTEENVDKIIGFMGLS